MKRACCTFLLAASVLMAAPAAAQGSAEAAELFKQGRAALEAKDYVTACTKLAESNRLERAVGTLISLAQCYEGQNKLATARQHWQEAADLADATSDRLQRGPIARDKVAELDKKVGRLTVKRAAGAPPSTAVKRDDVSLTSASFGSAFPVDPGKHVLIASAEGFEPKTYEIEIKAGESREIEIAPGAALPTPPPTTAGTPAERPPEAGDPNGGRKIAAYTLGGVGILGLGLGTIFGLSASSKWSDAKSRCPANGCSTQERKEADDMTSSARSAGTLSTVAFIVGTAALASGVVLLLTAPSPTNAATLRVVPTAGGAMAVGTF